MRDLIKWMFEREGWQIPSILRFVADLMEAHPGESFDDLWDRIEPGVHLVDVDPEENISEGLPSPFQGFSRVSVGWGENGGEAWEFDIEREEPPELPVRVENIEFDPSGFAVRPLISLSERGKRLPIYRFPAEGHGWKHLLN